MCWKTSWDRTWSWTPSNLLIPVPPCEVTENLCMPLTIQTLKKKVNLCCSCSSLGIPQNPKRHKPMCVCVCVHILWYGETLSDADILLCFFYNIIPPPPSPAPSVMHYFILFFLGMIKDMHTSEVKEKIKFMIPFFITIWINF